MKRLALAALVVLSACSRPASEKLAVMVHPETKQTAQCTVDPWHTWEWQYAEVIQQCVEGYERAGFKRVDKPAS